MHSAHPCIADGIAPAFVPGTRVLMLEQMNAAFATLKQQLERKRQFRKTLGEAGVMVDESDSVARVLTQIQTLENHRYVVELQPDRPPNGANCPGAAP